MGARLISACEHFRLEEAEMGKIRVRVKAPFGEIVVEGESAQEVLATLKSMPPQFVNEVSGLISANLSFLRRLPEMEKHILISILFYIENLLIINGK